MDGVLRLERLATAVRQHISIVIARNGAEFTLEHIDRETKRTALCVRGRCLQEVAGFVPGSPLPNAVEGCQGALKQSTDRGEATTTARGRERHQRQFGCWWSDVFGLLA